MWWLWSLALAGLNADEVSAGQGHSCAVSVGQVWCWGGATREQVKAGTWSARRVPERVGLPSPARTVSAGGMGQSCAVTEDRAVWCWGLDTTPSRVDGVEADTVSVGLAHVCATGPRGTWCWGSNANGQLGTGAAAAVSGVFKVAEIGFAQVSAGATHTCGVRADGTVWCWGANDVGQLGSKPEGSSGVPPRPVMWLQDAISVQAGSFHTCAIRAGGGVLCWGDNLDGQLGDGTRTRSVAPVVPRAVDGILSLSAGFGHTCAVRRDGHLLCWGASEAGQIGSDDDGDHLFPGRVRDVEDARAVSAGQQHTCVLRADGVHCVGGNVASQLGDGGKDGRSRLGPVAQPKTGEVPR